MWCVPYIHVPTIVWYVHPYEPGGGAKTREEKARSAVHGAAYLHGEIAQAAEIPCWQFQPLLGLSNSGLTWPMLTSRRPGLPLHTILYYVRYHSVWYSTAATHATPRHATPRKRAGSGTRASRSSGPLQTAKSLLLVVSALDV